MIGFVIPLKSAQVSNSWEHVSRLLNRTLQSICNQTDENFKVIVACHEYPSDRCDVSHPNIEFIQVKFPAPAPIGNLNEEEAFNDLVQGKLREKMRLDRQRKTWTGLNYLKKYSPTHVMVVDADDCISKNIASYVSQYPDKNGWYIERGYEYADQSNRIYLRSNFYQRCGTSHILKFDLMSPEMGEFSEVTSNHLRHQNFRKNFDDRGFHLECLPFEGAVYVVDNQENITAQKKYALKREKNFASRTLLSLRSVGKSFLSKPPTKSIIEDFGLYSVLPSS